MNRNDEFLLPFDGGYIWSMDDGRYGFMDDFGTWIIAPTCPY